MNLNDKLLQYYENYARIKDESMTEARTVYNVIKDEIASNLGDHLRLKMPNVGIEDFIDTGSAKEGLKVVKPDEFDVMILYKLGREEEYKWVMSPSDQRNNRAPGFVFICKRMLVQCIELESGNVTARPLTSIINEENQLNPALLRKCFHAGFQRIVNDSETRMKSQNITISLRPTGPSMQVDVKYGWNLEKKMSIDFIPTVVIDDDWFIPKSYPIKSQDMNASSDQDSTWQSFLWRWSYSRQEMTEIQQFDIGNSEGVGGHRKLLMIIKAISLNHHAQFGLLSSYHYKTVLLHLLNNRSAPDDWSDSKMAERLVDYFNSLVLFMQAQRLPNYFNDNVNLLEDFTTIALKNFENYVMNNILKKKDIEQLLVPRKM